MPTRILIVDDNPELLSLLKRALLQEGYEVVACPDGESALAAVSAQLPDLIVLDLLLPDVDGLDLCFMIQEISDAPILMLTSRDTVDDRVEGFRVGAADYVIKPFAMRELLARIEALVRRRPAGARRIEYKDLVVDFDSRRVTRGEAEVALTPKEFQLLIAVARNPDRVVTRESLFTALWPDADTIDENLLDAHMTKLRQKLENNGQPRLIQTVRGVGFVLR
ncbi:MAG: response regulator transcription factor [Dehalococcoidia bacterium]|nr:response regulator transcription factor [Dehalococcoidia bacterium]